MTKFANEINFHKKYIDEIRISYYDIAITRNEFS